MGSAILFFDLSFFEKVVQFDILNHYLRGIAFYLCYSLYIFLRQVGVTSWWIGNYMPISIKYLLLKNISNHTLFKDISKLIVNFWQVLCCHCWQSGTQERIELIFYQTEGKCQSSPLSVTAFVSCWMHINNVLKLCWSRLYYLCSSFNVFYENIKYSKKSGHAIYDLWYDIPLASWKREDVNIYVLKKKKHKLYNTHR